VEVVTFYSYKGGVGRTLLLAWMARALAARGKRVLALDLDLEAPGLPSKLRPMSEPKAGLGVVDLLLRFQGGGSPPTDLEQWCLAVATERGSLWLLPAGAAPSPAYWHALSKISWETLFVERAADGARFFLWLRDALAKAMEPDFLLIDARTGVTEMGAAAVGLLADTVIAVTNTSPESKTGLRGVLRAAVGSPRANRPPLRVLPVLSRVPALLGADDDARLVDQMQRFLNEEAEPLTSTLAIERVLAIHHEEALLEDEQRVLIGPRLRVCTDYERVLAWLVRETVPGPDVDLSLPRASQLVEAVRAQEEVVAAYRESTEGDPTHYLPMLADALAGLVRDLADLGRQEQALAAAEEAVVIYRRLAIQRPEISPTLAMSLNNLGLRLSELGRREEALAATQDAVEVYRTLAEARPEAFLPNLALSLNNLSNRQGEMGRRKEALLSISEAVEIRRKLAEQRPEMALPDLAGSLTNRSICQSELGDHEGALKSSTEAVDLYRAFAQQRPDAFLPGFATSLNNVAKIQGELAQGEAALSSSREALELSLTLVEREPRAFAKLFQAVFDGYRHHLQALGRAAQSDPLARRASETLQRLDVSIREKPASED
jgi:tetratricopeptide (TPR) repeat protein